MTARSVPEWIGATPDTAIPARVKLRIFERANGICHLSHRKIMPGEKWEADHIIALINGGENRESNLAPALTKAHQAKTAQDVAEKAAVAGTRKKHLGIKTRKGPPMPGSKLSRWKRCMDGRAVRRP